MLETRARAGQKGDNYQAKGEHSNVGLSCRGGVGGVCGVGGVVVWGGGGDMQRGWGLWLAVMLPVLGEGSLQLDGKLDR